MLLFVIKVVSQRGLRRCRPKELLLWGNEVLLTGLGNSIFAGLSKLVGGALLSDRSTLAGNR